ncbi:MAG: TIGR01777 family protein [Deltaproteobacteria bacterium]|nr:TIGR01777 family protein [Deltaproteobacteria bacterium]
MSEYDYRSGIEVLPQEVYNWHVRPGAFERLVPPWETVRIVDPGDGVAEGSRVTLEMKRGPKTFRWVAEHYDVVPGEQFSDRQIEGPFAKWEHQHLFKLEAKKFCVVEDHVRYELPVGALGKLVAGRSIAKDIHRTFRFRHDRTRHDLSRHRKFKHKDKLKVAVTGASGLVGAEFCNFLTAGGHEVVRLVRRAAENARTEAYWDPTVGNIDAKKLEGCDAVVHLAGENVGEGTWDGEKKRRIRTSRVKGTHLISEAIAKLKNPPKVLISASALGYYGNRGNEELTEDSPPGEGFLAEVCQEWEAAAEPAKAAGIRVVNLRIGVVLAHRGGALSRMIKPFSMGLGGKVSSGDQFMSWIVLDDLIGLMHYLIYNDKVEGPVNAVSPNPASNAEFTKALGQVLRRPTVATLPAGVVRKMMGEMGEELLLSSARLIPAKAQDAGYKWFYPELIPALCLELGRPPLDLVE